jgi:predicted Zn-dependent peptidase
MTNKFYRKVLKNGMTILFEKRDLPVVSVAFAVRYGGVNEKAEERGIAHFIEHLLYKGTKNRTHRQISEDIEKNGGVLNGFTEEMLTAYWCKMPSNKLNIALDVLGDMVRNPIFDKGEMEKERKVIFEEMKVYHDAPRHYVFEKIQSCLYGNPLGIPLIGTHKTLNSITREKMVEKFNKIYNPKNIILCVVGDANFKDIVKYAEKNFVKIKNVKSLEKSVALKVVKKNKSETEKRRGIDQANLVIAFHSPLANDKKVYAAKLLMNIMANGLSSRLFHEIREKRNLAYSVFGDITDNKHFSYSYVYAGVMKENVELVKKLILEEFRKVSRDLTEKEVSQAKDQLIGNHRLSQESSDAQTVQLLLFEIEGNARDFYNFEKNIRDVKLSDVKNIAKIKDYSFFALIPE